MRRLEVRLRSGDAEGGLRVSRALERHDVCRFRRIAIPLETSSIASPVLSRLAKLDEKHAINSKLRRLRGGGAAFGDMLV